MDHQKFDEFETQCAEIARTVATYYEKLIECKVPDELAHKLTENFAQQIWTTFMMSGMIASMKLGNDDVQI